MQSQRIPQRPATKIPVIAAADINLSSTWQPIFTQTGVNNGFKAGSSCCVNLESAKGQDAKSCKQHAQAWNRTGTYFSALVYAFAREQERLQKTFVVVMLYTTPSVKPFTPADCRSDAEAETATRWLLCLQLLIRGYFNLGWISGSPGSTWSGL